MATVAVVATVIGAGAAVASAVTQQRRQRKMAREQRRQNEIQNRMARARRAREVRQSIAAQRVRAAEAIAAGFQFGVPGSTAVQQAVGAGQTDLASAIGASQVQLGGAEAIAASQNRVSSIAAQSDPFAVIAAGAGMFSDPQLNRAAQQQFGFGVPGAQQG